MTQEEYRVWNDFHAVHGGDQGALVLADQLFELGFIKKHTTQEQNTLFNYAIHVVEKMGVVTDGQKYQLCLHIAKYLQTVTPEGEIDNGRE